MTKIYDAYGLEVKYHARNIKIVKAAIQNHTQRAAKRKIIKMLELCAERLVDMVDDKFMPWPSKLPHGGSATHPVWVGQMHDATGVGIYDDGKVIHYLPTKKALDTQPQYDHAHNDWYIIGNERLREAIQMGITQFSEGLWIVLFCAVPYANIVNTQGSPWSRGKDFFTHFSEDLFDWITDGLTAMRP